MKLHTLTDKFLLAYTGVYSPKTVQWYKNRFKPLLQNCWDRDIHEINIDALREQYALLVDKKTLYEAHPHDRKIIKKGYSKYTLHTFARAWKRLFTWAVEEEYLVNNPGKRLQLPRLPKPAPKAISRNAVMELLRAAKSFSTKPERDYAIIRFLASTNARVGGVAGLCIDDLDLENRSATVHEKGRGGSGNLRVVFFDTETAKALDIWLKTRKSINDNRVFALSECGIYQMIERRANNVRVNGPYNPHSFRHCFAKETLQQGANLAQVSQMMGHSSSVVTVEYYGQFATRELQEFHDRYSWVPDSY